MRTPNCSTCNHPAKWHKNQGCTHSDYDITLNRTVDCICVQYKAEQK